MSCLVGVEASVLQAGRSVAKGVHLIKYIEGGVYFFSVSTDLSSCSQRMGLLRLIGAGSMTGRSYRERDPASKIQVPSLRSRRFL